VGSAKQRPGANQLDRHNRGGVDRPEPLARKVIAGIHILGEYRGGHGIRAPSR
jgi:hypothetical protein